MLAKFPGRLVRDLRQAVEDQDAPVLAESAGGRRGKFFEPRQRQGQLLEMARTAKERIRQI